MDHGFASTVDIALLVGNALIKRGVFANTGGDQPFKNEELLYRFKAHDEAVKKGCDTPALLLQYGLFIWIQAHAGYDRPAECPACVNLRACKGHTNCVYVCVCVCVQNLPLTALLWAPGTELEHVNTSLALL